MLAAASPHLLGPNLQSDDSEEEMVCLHLPDYTSACVASVLSILYYGETWIQTPDQELQVDTINSLLLNLGVQLEVVRENNRIFLRQKVNVLGNNLKKQRIKKEPVESAVTYKNTMMSPAKIKREKIEQRTSKNGSLFPLVQTGSLLKLSLIHI